MRILGYSAVWRICIALLSSLLVLMLTVLLWEGLLIDQDQQKVFPFTLNKLQFERGRGEITPERISILGYAGQQIRLGSSWVLLDTKKYPYVKMTLHGLEPGMKLLFYWRTTEKPDRKNRLRISRMYADSSFTMNLGRHKGWQKTVIQVGFELEDALERRLEINQLQFLSATHTNQVLSKIDQLGYRDPWSMRSTHFLLGATWKEDAVLTQLLFVWVILAGIFYLGLTRKYGCRPASHHLLILFFVAWLVFDLRWVLNHAAETRHTQIRFAGKSVDQAALAAMDGPLYQLSKIFRQTIGNNPETRVFILGDNEKSKYQRYRLQYHLLPVNAFNYHKFPRLEYADVGDYLIIVGEIQGLKYKVAKQAIEWGSPRKLIRVKPLVGNKLAVLFQITADLAEDQPLKESTEK